VAIAEGIERWLLDVAVPLDEARTTRMESARTRRIDRARDVAFEDDGLALAPELGIRDRNR
jgi:hypothetical protein